MSSLQELTLSELSRATSDNSLEVIEEHYRSAMRAFLSYPTIKSANDARKAYRDFIDAFGIEGEPRRRFMAVLEATLIEHLCDTRQNA